MAKIKWEHTGWTTIREADAKKHVLGVACKTVRGVVEEVRIRHNDGEEKIAKVTLNGENALPMDMAEFEKHFTKDELELK